VAAWTLALAPSHVYFTSVAMTETAYVTFTLVGLLLAGVLVDRATDRPRPWFGYGVYVGFAALINLGGLILAAGPALTRRALGGSWRGAFLRFGAVLAGLAVVLGIWTVRNGTQVGVWSPAPTSNAMAICMGHRPGADGTGHADAATIRRCFRNDEASATAPRTELLEHWLASQPDEADWYYRNNREALEWAIRHPAEELELVWLKVFATMRNDGDAIDAAGDFGSHTLGSTGIQHGLGVLAGFWYYPVLFGALLSIARVPAVRRAAPLWATAGLYLLGVVAFQGATRYHHAVMALLAVCLAGGLTPLLDRWRPVATPADDLVIDLRDERALVDSAARG
jgi:hypothetical protein